MNAYAGLDHRVNRNTKRLQVINIFSAPALIFPSYLRIAIYMMSLIGLASKKVSCTTVVDKNLLCRAYCYTYYLDIHNIYKFAAMMDVAFLIQ